MIVLPLRFTQNFSKYVGKREGQRDQYYGPARSPDRLSILLGIFKPLVHGATVNSLEKLQLRIHKKCQHIPTKRGVLERISFKDIMPACKWKESKYLEHLI